MIEKVEEKIGDDQKVLVFFFPGAGPKKLIVASGGRVTSGDQLSSNQL